MLLCLFPTHSGMYSCLRKASFYLSVHLTLYQQLLVSVFLDEVTEKGDYAPPDCW